MRPNSPKSFVGRDSELSTLNELLERSTHGQGQIAFVTGDAGIGKTHLVTEFGRQARRRQVEVVSGRARELGGAPPYSLWIPLLTDLFGSDDPNLVQLNSATTRIIPKNESDVTRFRLFESIASSIKKRSEHSPTLIVLENL